MWIAGFYSHQTAGLVYGTRWQVSIVLGLLALAAIVLKGRFRVDQATLCIVLLILLALVSTAYSFSPMYTALRTASALLLVLSTYFLCKAIIRNEEDIRRMFFSFLVLYAVLLAIFYYSSLTDSFAFASARLQGNEFFKATGGGNMLVSAGLLAIWYLKYCSSAQKPLILLLLIIIAVSIVLTRARVPIAGALLTWPVAFIFIRGGRLNKGVFALLAVCLATTVYVYFSPEAAKLLRVDERELNSAGYDISTGRLDRWQFLLELSSDERLLGYGFGTSRYARWRWTYIHEDYLTWTNDINDTRVQQNSHSQHVQILFELGIVGLGLFWLFLYLVLKRGYTTSLLSNTPETMMLKIMFLSICFHLLDSFSHDGLLSSGNPASYLFWMKVGLFMEGSRIVLRKARMPIPEPAHERIRPSRSTSGSSAALT